MKKIRSVCTALPLMLACATQLNAQESLTPQTARPRVLTEAIPIGARTAGYFGKGRKAFDRFHLAVPARPGRGGEVWIHAVRD